MGAKEKAKELVEEFIDIEESGLDCICEIGTAKQCAIICVDEIFKVFRLYQSPDEVQYWEEVKEEINKL